MAKSQMDNFRCGMVSIVGRPNVGKSTLLNTILGEKVAIVSRIPQTTRNKIRGIYNDERCQIIFIDTPGFHRGKDSLDDFMNRASSSAMDDVDCIVHLVDTTRVVGQEEEMIVDRLKAVKVPIILGLNKIDIKKRNVAEYIALWESAKAKPVTELDNFTMITLSGKDAINIKELIDIIYSYLPEGQPLYPQDTVSDMPQKLAIADIIREKFLFLLREELPHSLGVVIEHIQPIRRRTTHIKALVFVERQTQKEIVIGKAGMMLKKVGSLAREELEELLGTKVFLELFVKVQKKWRDDVHILQELGYDSFDYV